MKGLVTYQQAAQKWRLDSRAKANTKKDVRTRIPDILFEKRSSCAGTVFVEFSLVALLFLGFVLAFIECARYMAIRITLNKAVHVALNQAIKTPHLEYNLDSSPSATDSNNNSYADFVKERSRIIGLAVKKATGGLISGSADTGAAKLTPFCTESGALVDAIIVRPGDLYRKGDCSSGELLEHPTRNSTAVTINSNVGLLMRNNPIIVRMEVQMTPIVPIPFLPVLTIQATASGYREDNPTGAFPAPLAANMLAQAYAIT